VSVDFAFELRGPFPFACLCAVAVSLSLSMVGMGGGVRKAGADGELTLNSRWGRVAQALSLAWWAHPREQQAHISGGERDTG